MTIKIVKVLVATVALGALILGTAPSMARPGGGGGGGGHGGGGHGGAGGILVRRAVVAEAILVLRMSVALAWAPLG